MQSNRGFSPISAADVCRQAKRCKTALGHFLAIILASWLSAVPAEAQATRTYVSGAGKDTNACTADAPCLTLQTALARTAPGGQIYPLDSANYGYVTINKAVSIMTGRGATGVLATSSLTGVAINAGANDIITLQGLDIDGAGSGANGIQFISGASLNIQDSVIRGFTTGINFQPSGASALLVSKTLISNNSTGINFRSTAASTGALNDVQIVNNGTGVVALGASSTSPANLSFQGSLVANSGSAGIVAGAFSGVSIANSTVTNNVIGLQAQTATSLVQVSGSSVTGNRTAWQATNGGQVLSASKNSFGGNASGDTASSATLSVIVKNIVTDFGAKCNGMANDVNAFLAFRAWALANQGTSQITLTIPSGARCMFLTTAAQRWVQDIKNLVVIGYGATISNTGNSNPGFFLGGAGIKQDASHSARTATVEAGSSCVTLLTPAQTSLFTPGNYALMTGFDLQGVWKANYGYPPNLHYFDYVVVSSVNAGTGVVCFTLPLTNTYKSTWPHYADGNVFEVDQGGPATLYYLDPSWNTTVEYRGLTIEQNNFQTYAIGKSVTYRDVTFTGGNCGIPTQNLLWQAINTDMSNCNMEVDKIIGEAVLDGVTIHILSVQSSSVNLLTLRNLVVTSQLNGTPKVANISDSTIASFNPGAYAYGRSDEVVCENCVLPAIAGMGVTEKGSNDIGVNLVYSMNGGVISYPNGSNITGAANNGSGKVRLTVVSTTGFVTGQTVNVSGIIGTTEANGGNRLITVIDRTHVDLPQIPFAHAYVNGGVVGNPAPRWAVPGTNLMWAGQLGNEGAFRVVDVTQDANNTYVRTTLSGGFPSVLLSSGKLALRVHPAPRFTCTNCTGSADAIDLSQAPAGAPLYSYSKRTYAAGAPGTTPAPKFEMWGALSSVKFNVTKPYTGTLGLTLNALSQFNNYMTMKADNSTFTYGPTINLKAAGERVVTASAVTGTQTGDKGLAVPEAVWFTGKQFAGPTLSSNISGENPSVLPSITIEIATDQGVVNP